MASRKESAASGSNPLDTPVKQIQIDGLVSDIMLKREAAVCQRLVCCVQLYVGRGAQSSRFTVAGSAPTTYRRNTDLCGVSLVDMYHGNTRTLNVLLLESVKWWYNHLLPSLYHGILRDTVVLKLLWYLFLTEGTVGFCLCTVIPPWCS